MPLSTYDELQTSILSWLARPGDPLVSPAVPDMIQLFEREATRRLKVGGAEKRASLTALSAAVALPADFGELRLATSGGVILTYVTPMQLPDGGGSPAHYTIIGNEMRLGPAPSGGCTIEIVYQSGVPPLSDTNISNWLLAQHPDCYLFGSLVEAESFIGSDDRIPLWAQRREAAFSSIESADRKARWGGAPLSIRAEGVSGGNGTAAGDWTSAPPAPIPITGIVAGDGLSGGGTEGLVTVSLSTPVTIGRGGTGAATAADALLNLGAAPLNSPALIGNPTAPTPAPGDNDTSIATTGFVQAALVAQTLAGDVTGPTSTTAVVRLQGRPVAATAPTSLQVLQWSGTNWVPATIAAGGTLTGVTAGAGITVSGTAPSPTVALTVPVAVVNGGTGSTTATAALTALGAAPLVSPAFAGTPSLPTGTTAVTQTAGTSNTTVATTAFVATSFAPLNAPVFTGDARAVTPATADNDTSIATTAYVQAQGYAMTATLTANYAPLTSPVFSGAPSLPTGAIAVTQGAGTSNTSIATTAFVAARQPSTWTVGFVPFATGAQTLGQDVNLFWDNTNKRLGIDTSSPTRTLEVFGNASAINYEIGQSRTTDIGTFGFINANGPAITLRGSGVATPGVMQFSTAATVAMTIGPTQIITALGPVRLTPASQITPDTDNQCYCGSPSLAFFQNNSHNYATISDPAKKTDIAAVPDGMLAQVMAIEPFSYLWKTEDPDNPKHWGFMAPDVAVAMGPDFAGVMRDKESGVFTLSYNDLTAVLWKAVQELAAKVAALEGGASTPQRRRQ